MGSKKQPKNQSLADFVRERTRQSCPVCQLPEEVKAQLGPAATKKGFKRAEQLAWLQEAVGATHITADLLNAHFNGRHEQ